MAGSSFTFQNREKPRQEAANVPDIVDGRPLLEPFRHSRCHLMVWGQPIYNLPPHPQLQVATPIRVGFRVRCDISADQLLKSSTQDVDDAIFHVMELWVEYPTEKHPVATSRLVLRPGFRPYFSKSYVQCALTDDDATQYDGSEGPVTAASSPADIQNHLD